MGRPQYIRQRHSKTGRFTGAIPVPRCSKTGRYLKVDKEVKTIAKPVPSAKSRKAVSK